jgi:hypothetical protein
VRNVTFPSTQAICLSILALVQVALAIALLSWALPLLLDPPATGSMVASVSYKIDRLVAKYPHQLEGIGWAPEHFRWLFHSQMEGVWLALGTVVALLGSAQVLVVFACLQLRNSSVNSIKKQQ